MKRSLPLLLIGLLLLTVRPASADDLPAIGMKEGQMFPDFLLPDVDGNFGRLSDYRGKKVLLFNFASW